MSAWPCGGWTGAGPGVGAGERPAGRGLSRVLSGGPRPGIGDEGHRGRHGTGAVAAARRRLAAGRRVYFQFEPDGQITSPRTPTGAGLRRAVPQYISQEAVELAQSRLARLRAITDRTQLLALLPHRRRPPPRLPPICLIPSR